MKNPVLAVLALLAFTPMLSGIVDALWWFFTDHSLLVEWDFIRVTFAWCWTIVMGGAVGATAEAVR